MIVLAFLPKLLGGALVTLKLTALSALVALGVSLGVGILRLSRWQVVRGLALLYVEIFRGTSALVQIFYFFFVLPLLGIRLSPLTAGVLALGLNFGSYGSEVVRAAILNVPRGQREAAVALNLSRATTLRRIILPQAFVAMLPPFGNLLIDLLKSTSLLSLITLSDLTFAGKVIVQGQGHVTDVYVLVLLIYFVMAFLLGRFMREAERRVSRGLHLGPAQ
jgi:polar amino acid transport system permease protein